VNFWEKNYDVKNLIQADFGCSVIFSIRMFRQKALTIFAKKEKKDIISSLFCMLDPSDT